MRINSEIADIKSLPKKVAGQTKRVGDFIKEQKELVKHLPQELKESIQWGKLSKRAQDLLAKTGEQVLRLIPHKSINFNPKNTIEERQHLPAIIFISGLEISGIDDDENGMNEMANDFNEFFEGVQHYSWKDKSEIIEEIKLRAADQKVILIGHGLGSDTAVEVANDLKRPVELLFTLDSVGVGNDIIPENVIKNFNVVSNQESFIGDGGNIAVNSEVTTVVNSISDMSHNEVPESFATQDKIYMNILDLIGLKK